MGDDKSLERRRDLRAEVSVSVEVREGKDFAIHATRDISIGGVYFDRAIPYRVGARVQLAFTLPGDTKSIRCEGEVVNVPDKHGYGMGVRFLEISPLDQKRVQDFVHELAGEPP